MRYVKALDVTAAASSTQQETLLTGLASEKRTVQSINCESNADAQLTVWHENTKIIDSVETALVNDIHGLDDLGIELAEGETLKAEISNSGGSSITVQVVVVYDVA